MRYRGDIDGLRAVSILLVVAYHSAILDIHGGFVGVDVFFVISGFLITGLLVREHDERGRISLPGFIAGRIRRLMPMAGLVALATLVVGTALTAPSQRPRLFDDATSAVLYVSNWRFADQAVAYSDARVQDGLFLHYWSLSIEEQFYVVWPLLLIVVSWFARRILRRSFVGVLLVVVVVMTATSFGAACITTSTAGPKSYFLSHARVWEMGVGAIVALTAERLRRMPNRIGLVLAAAGLAAIAFAALTFDATTSFPGPAALLPVAGAAALIATGGGAGTAVSRALDVAPLRRLGRLSYSWYLWHWPALGVGRLLDDRYDVDLDRRVIAGAAVLVSLILAVISHRFVEEPIRRSPWVRARVRRSLVAGLATSAVAVVAGVGYRVSADVGDRQIRGATMTAAEAAADDVKELTDDCHMTLLTVELEGLCELGDPEGPIRVAVIGDSHAQHWVPAFDVAGQERGWQVFVSTRSACIPYDVNLWNERLAAIYDGCREWTSHVVDQLRALGGLDLVVIARTFDYPRWVREQDGATPTPTGASDALRIGSGASFGTLLNGVTSSVVVLEDTPWSPRDVPSCLSELDPSRCAFARDENSHLDAEILRAEQEAAASPALGEGVRFVDLTTIVCDTDPCEVIDAAGVIKFRDAHHLTATFSRSLGTALADALDVTT